VDPSLIFSWEAALIGLYKDLQYTFVIFTRLVTFCLPPRAALPRGLNHFRLAALPPKDEMFATVGLLAQDGDAGAPHLLGCFLLLGERCSAVKAKKPTLHGR
jgi:hypothetical protein